MVNHVAGLCMGTRGGVRTRSALAPFIFAVKRCLVFIFVRRLIKGFAGGTTSFVQTAEHTGCCTQTDIQPNSLRYVIRMRVYAVHSIAGNVTSIRNEIIDCFRTIHLITVALSMLVSRPEIHKLIVWDPQTRHVSPTL